jgi:hypothetical protein
VSVNQSVLAYYGWLVPVSEAIKSWVTELDYDLPMGARLIGMDSNTIVFGAQLFESGDYRWGPMQGDNASITQVEMYGQFTQWFFKEGGDQLVQRFSQASWGKEKLHIFIDTY